MKIYVDLSCDKVSGQQMMQRALLKQVKEVGLYSEKETADILVYVQVPFDDNIVEEWKQLKALGKKIVFVHHYMSKSFYERCAIFKIDGLFELIDKHICYPRCELYEYLISRGVVKQDIFCMELAAAQYDDLNKRYWKKSYDKTNTICFAGSVVKGLDKFVRFCELNNIADPIILCPNIHKYTGNLNNYTVYSDKQYDEVYEEMSKCKYFYCPSVYNTPAFHLETSLQEAIACGCIPVVDDSYEQILQTLYFDSLGFVRESEFKRDRDELMYQFKSGNFQHSKYLTLSQMLNKLIDIIKSFV